jgi:hypothetical protein
VRACRLLADFVEKVAWAIGQLPYLVFTMPELLYVVAKTPEIAACGSFQQNRLRAVI